MVNTTIPDNHMIILYKQKATFLCIIQERYIDNIVVNKIHISQITSDFNTFG